MKECNDYDVCIVGAGPAALACLSAIQEPFSIDSLTEHQINRAERVLSASDSSRHRKVCVVDPHSSFMAGWKSRFEALRIPFLRSPALAHPSLFDQNALLAYAVATGREDELYESGCSQLRSLLALGQSQIGLWKLPSTSLFNSFCEATLKSLSHDYIQGSIVDICKRGSVFHLQAASGRKITARAVILGMGTVGCPVVPLGIRNAPNVYSWTDMDMVEKKGSNEKDGVGLKLETSRSSADCKSNCEKKTVLVIGGGLTAVQAALRLAQSDTSPKVILCSRRPLVTRHFDLPMDWFDRRTATKCQADFYHESISQRLSQIKQTRGGGSVPPIYTKELREWQNKGRIVCVVGQPEYIKPKQTSSNSPEANQEMCGDKDTSSQEGQQENDTRMHVFIESSVYEVDDIVLACGVQPDCLRHPLIQRVQRQWPIAMPGGFPAVSQDLQWSTSTNWATPDTNDIDEDENQKDGECDNNCHHLFVIGGLASLNIGPDAANLMGIRRGASIIANALSCRCWLRDRQVLSNPFN